MDLGVLFRAKKLYPKARKHLEEAIRIFEETGAYAFLEQTRKELSLLPDRNG